MRIAPLTVTILVLTGVGWAADARPDYPPLPEAFSSFGAAISGDHVYVYGGHTGKTHTYSTDAVTGKFRRLNLADARKGWEELPTGPAIQGLALVAHGGKVYRVGGMQPRNAPGEPADSVSVATCAVFDPTVGKWEPLPDLPAGRSSHDAVVVGNRLVVAGGWQMKGKGNDSSWHDTALILDLTQKPLRWEAIPQPFQRRALQAAVLDGKVYVCGGMTAEDTLALDVAVLDPATKQWTTAPALPGPKRNGFTPAACAADGRLYVSPPDGKVYRLTEKRDGWEEVGSLEKARLVHRMVPARDNQLLILGGASRGGNVALIETIVPRAAEK